MATDRVLLTALSCGDARDLLRWSESDLARHLGFSVTTIEILEAKITNLDKGSRMQLTLKLTAAGILFPASRTIMIVEIASVHQRIQPSEPISNLNRAKIQEFTEREKR